MTAESERSETSAPRFFERAAQAESARERGAWLRGLTMEERGELALRLLAFAETMRQSTGPRPRRPLDRSLVSIMTAARNDAHASDTMTS